VSKKHADVHWTLPLWAAQLILETIKIDSESTSFDPRLRKQLAAVLSVIAEKPMESKPAHSSFDLFRLSKSKVMVDLSPNTLRAYNREGLTFYRQGKAVFVSKNELTEFIRFRSPTRPSNKNTQT
jgi:hypothetical protein